MAGTEARDLLRGIGNSFWAALIAVVLIAVTLVALHVAERRSDAWVLHTREVARQARQAQYLATNRNTAVRGYLLLSDRRLLRADSLVAIALDAKLDSLLATVRVPVQRERLIRLGGHLGAWHAGLAARVARAEPAELVTLRQQLSASDEDLFQPIRDEFTAFLTAEDDLYRAGVAQSWRVRNVAILVLLAELLVIAIVLVGFRGRLSSQAGEMAVQQEELENQATELEEQASELEHQTEQAQDLARELEASNVELAEALETAVSARASESAAVQARAEAYLQLDAALECAPVGFAFYDRELRYVRVNPTLAALSGLTPKEHVGQRISDTLPALAPMVLPVLEKVLETGKPELDVEITGATPAHGQQRSFRASYYPIRQNGGRPIGVGAVVLDTSVQRELETQLRQAQKMEAVGQLAGGIAHDFNNMLTAITSFSELLLAELSDDSQHRGDVLEIQRAANRAAALTRQLLAFSRRQLLQPVPLDLNGVIQELEEMLRRILAEDVDLVCRFDRELELAVADPGQIEQIVMNLAVNARDAMPSGGRLTIETRNAQVDAEYASRAGEMTPGAYVVLAVSDTGTGMDEATQRRIFEPFFTTKEPGKGTGLGLSTVYGIVKQSNGHVSVYSEQGRGTTFRIYLPVAAAPERRATPPRVPTLPVPSGSETILLVEDDPAVRLVASRILGRQGYRVLEAPSPAAAQALVAAHPGSIDLVMTDLVLPDMSGRELAELLMSVQPRLRVLYMSGYTDDAVIRRGLLEPGMPFLSKPFTLEEIARAVRSALDGVPGTR